MNKYIVCCLLLLLQNFSYADVSLCLSRDKFSVDESFQVTFSSNKKIIEKPDFTPLEQDFDILSNSVAMSTSIINGQISEETKWSLNLMPKHEGLITIPSIKFQQESSLPKEIEVKASNGIKQDEAIFIETEILDTPVYEQTPLIYTIRLYSSHQMVQGSLSEIKTSDADAIVERVDKDVQYETFYKNGKRYMVIERKYMIIPQHAGELIIYPSLFEGSILTRSYSMFDVQTTFKKVYSSLQKLDVQKAPASFTEPWFAANDLQLAEEWSAPIDQINLGEPLTWTLTLKADGALANQIPDITPKFPKDMKFYLDKPELINKIKSDEIKSSKQIKIALIPSKPGEFIIPELKIHWWNLKTDKAEEILLPTKTIRVLGEEVAMIDPIQALKEDAPLKVEEPLVEPALGVEVSSQMPLLKIILIALSLLCFMLLLLFLRYLVVKSNQGAPARSRKAKNQLKGACLKNDAKSAELFLLTWAALVFPEIKPLNLISIKNYLPDELRGEIDELYEALYSPKKSWEGSSLWKAMASFQPKKNKPSKLKTNQNPIRELY